MSSLGQAFNRRFSAGLGNSVNRDLWVQKALSDVPDGSRILDAGAGECQYRRFCSHLDYVAQDFAQYDGQGNSAGLQTREWDNSRIDIVSDIALIPEADATYDAILCTEVFEHIPNPVLAIQEFSRLLKSGGRLIITAPFWSLTHFSPYHFAGGFNRYYYEHHLPEHGFESVVIEQNGNYFESVAQELRRIQSMSRSHSSKPSGLLSKISTAVLLMSLSGMSNTDTGSEDLLCFGLHVTARRS